MSNKAEGGYPTGFTISRDIDDRLCLLPFLVTGSGSPTQLVFVGLTFTYSRYLLNVYETEHSHLRVIQSFLEQRFREIPRANLGS